jgi:hypothetical protein
MSDFERAERLQIMLSAEELAAVENWRFERRMPSRAAAVRELLRRGLASEGFLRSSRRISAFWSDRTIRRPNSTSQSPT